MQGGLYCANCKAEQVLDLRSGVTHSQGELEYASRRRRFAALLVDYLPIMVFGFFLGMYYATRGRSVGMFSPVNTGMGLLFICYEALMLGTRGQTLGKMALGVRVVNTDGSPISMAQGWGRAFARAILGWLLIVDYIPVLFTAEKTTLHDMLAKTRVVNA
jgi:uncharacterized RDD family membrane protein YckC